MKSRILEDMPDTNTGQESVGVGCPQHSDAIRVKTEEDQEFAEETLPENGECSATKVGFTAFPTALKHR